MSPLYFPERRLPPPSPMDPTFPDVLIYSPYCASAEKTAPQSQIAKTRVGQVQTDRHASWASTPESIGYLTDVADIGSGFGDRPSPPCSETPHDISTDYSSVSSVHFSSVNGSLPPLYDWLQQPANAITACTLTLPPLLHTHTNQFASGSTQSTNFRVSRTAIPRMNLDGFVDLCPGCYATPFPSVWTMEQLGCVHCELWLPAVAQPAFPPPAPAPASAMPSDRPRSPNGIPSSLQNRSRKGKSSPSRDRRPTKMGQSPTSPEEHPSCPFTSSGNLSLPCRHDACSPPPNVGLLSRRFEENDKWVRARQEAVASFSYENCGFYKLPMEILLMIIDLYPRLDYSYMRSIRVDASIYNHRFEVLRNLIGVSQSFRRTLFKTYWETFEIALTYPRGRLPDPGSLEPGTESPRYVSRVKELQGLSKMFWNFQDTAACIRTLTFRVDRDTEIMQLFVDCLLALPNLHTLEIAPTSLPLVTLFGIAFKHRPLYKSIRKLIAPAGAHPILQCLPNLEELVCTRGDKPHILLSKVFQAYDYVNTLTTFKRFELIGSNWTDMVGKELLRCFPTIQKLAMRRPSMAHLEKVASLTEISELELWVTSGTDSALIKGLKTKATEILRNSRPRVICKCDDVMDVDHEPSVRQEPRVELGNGVEPENEEGIAVKCRCETPKRVLRVKYLVRRHGQGGTPFWGVEETEVSSLGD